MKTFAPYKDPYKPQTQDELNSVAQKAASEHTLSKPTGPAKVVDAVATCSLPVSSAEIIDAANQTNDAAGLRFELGYGREAIVLEYCAEVLRRHATSMTERRVSEANRQVSAP